MDATQEFLERQKRFHSDHASRTNEKEYYNWKKVPDFNTSLDADKTTGKRALNRKQGCKIRFVVKKQVNRGKRRYSFQADIVSSSLLEVIFLTELRIAKR